MGQAPTSQARSRDVDYLRPSHLAAGTLSLVKHALSKFGGEPCSVRRRLVAAVNEVLCARNTFFLAEAAFRNGPSLPTALLACVSAMKGTPVLFSVF